MTVLISLTLAYFDLFWYYIEYVLWGTFCYRGGWPKTSIKVQRTLGAEGAPEPSAEARRRGKESPKLFVALYFDNYENIYSAKYIMMKLN